MHPILFTIGGFEVRSSAVFLILGIIVGIVVGRNETRKMGIARRDFTTFFVVAIPLAILFGAFNGLVFGVGVVDAFKNLGETLSTGLVSFGAVIILLAWGYVQSRINKTPPAPAMDLISTILPLVLGVYRIGCILNGCCYGRITDGPLGVYLPDLYGTWANRYPTQLMLMIFDFVLFAILWQWRQRNPKEGYLTIAFLLAFSTGRLLIDGLRDLPPALGMFSLHQLASLSILLITLYFVFEFRLEKNSSLKA